jgi:ABC-type dipeptide/oligopeptide/nickel transport system permease subunit
MKKQKTEPTKTVLTISMGFLAIYLIAKWNWASIAALVLGLVGIFSPYLSERVDHIWMKLTWLLSLIIPNILLSAVFYLVLFPVSIIARLTGAGSHLKLKNDADSFFRNRDKDFDKKNFEKPW